MSESILICNLSEPELAHRRQQIMTHLWPLLQNRTELEDGYAFQFPGTETAVRQVQEFVLMERACCPAFSIEMAFKPENGPLWLNIRGDGVKEFIANELGAFMKGGDGHGHA